METTLQEGHIHYTSCRRCMRRATRMVEGLGEYSYEDRLSILGLTTLERSSIKYVRKKLEILPLPLLQGVLFLTPPPKVCKLLDPPPAVADPGGGHRGPWPPPKRCSNFSSHSVIQITDNFFE